MLQFPYPDLCEFQLLGRPRRTKEEDLKVRAMKLSKAVRPEAQDMEEKLPMDGKFILVLSWSFAASSLL